MDARTSEPPRRPRSVRSVTFRLIFAAVALASGLTATPAAAEPPALREIGDIVDAPLRPDLPDPVSLRPTILRTAYQSEAAGASTSPSPPAAEPPAPLDLTETKPADGAGNAEAKPNRSDEATAAQTGPPDSAATEPTANAGVFDLDRVDVDAFRNRINGADVSDEERTQLLAEVDGIAGLLSAVDQQKSKATAIAERLSGLNDRLSELERQIESEATQPVLAESDLDGERLATRLLEADQKLAEARSNLKLASAQASVRQQRIAAIRKELADLKSQTDAAKKEAATPGGLAGELAELRRRVRLVELAERRQTLEAEERLLTVESESNLDSLVSRQATDRVAIAERRLQLLKAREDQVRNAEVAQTVRETKAAARSVSETLRPFAEINERLTEELAQLTRQRKDYERQRDSARKLSDEFELIEATYEDKLSPDAIDELNGLRLRSELFRLPNLAMTHAERTRNAALTRELQLDRFRVESERQQLGDPTETADALIAAAEPGSGLAAERDALIPLLQSRAELLRKLDDEYKASIQPLTDANDIDAELIERVEAFRQKAEAAVLWVRSNPSIFEAEWELSDRARALLRPDAYAERLRLLASDFRNSPAVYVIAALAGILLLVVRNRVWSNCQDSIRRAKRPNNVSLRPYVRVLLATFGLAAFWPVVIGFIGYRLDQSGDASSAELASGIFKLALLFFTLEFIRQACRKDGLVELLQVERSIATYVRRKILWLEWAALPLSAVVLLLHEGGVGRGTQLGERVCFAASAIVMSTFLHKLVRSRSPIVERSRRRETWLARYRVVIHALAVGLPVFFALLSLAGYHFAALRMAGKLQQTLWLGLGLLVANLLLVRLVLLHRRRLAISAMRDRADAADRPEQPQGTGAAAAQAKSPSPNAEFGELSDQLGRLIGTSIAMLLLAGLYAIWVDVVPSLRNIADFEFYSVEVNGGELRSVGPTDLALAVLIAILTVTAARNLPGLLEFTLLERLRLDRSVRYAVTTIASYVIAITGIVLTGKAAGFAWENVQWLAAGLTVGLGFGLQEIFANFVSGLIIFIEQPVRVGDIVTLGDVTGSVTRIRIRATTITNWDRKEYIVPNREFITGRLLNWTLSDQTNRVVVEVGVAYGSDISQVREIILQAARDNEEVLDDPSPVVTFEAFGDSSLNFVLRCFLPTLENRLATIHDLHAAINDRFREAEIEIPFPQRDLNVRQVPSEQLARIADRGDLGLVS